LIVTLQEKYREFGTLKSRIRDFFLGDNRFQIVGARPKYADQARGFDCPAVGQRLIISDEIDVAIERAAAEAFKAGGRLPTRIDFLRQPEAAGWFQVNFGLTPLPRPATQAALEVQHGAALVYSQNEIDGSVIALLYPPRGESFRRREKCIVLNFFKSPRFVDENLYRAHVDLLISYQKLGFKQRPRAWDRIRIWWLIKTRVVVWEGDTEPTQLRRGQWLIKFAMKSVGSAAVAAGGLLILYFLAHLLSRFGWTELSNVLLRRPS
jgi:hypothetical protein